MPEPRPTEKQLASLLKDTDSTASVLEASIGGRTFIVNELICTSSVSAYSTDLVFPVRELRGVSQS